MAKTIAKNTIWSFQSSPNELEIKTEKIIFLNVKYGYFRSTIEYILTTFSKAWALKEPQISLCILTNLRKCKKQFHSLKKSLSFIIILFKSNLYHPHYFFSRLDWEIFSPGYATRFTSAIWLSEVTVGVCYLQTAFKSQVTGRHVDCLNEIHFFLTLINDNKRSWEWWRSW